MVLIPNDDGEKTGAVTGETEGDLSENYFVREELAGVDGVDYPGKAMPLDYADLIALEDVPDEFRYLSITFLIEKLIWNISPGQRRFPPAEESLSCWQKGRSPITLS